MGYKQYWVYMLTNRWRNVLYTGITNSLERRCSKKDALIATSNPEWEDLAAGWSYDPTEGIPRRLRGSG